MTTLVIHAGAELVDRGVVLRELVAHRDELAAAGVVLPEGSDPAVWRRNTTELLRRESAAVARLADAKAAGAEFVLFSSDTAADPLAGPDEAARLAELGAQQGVDVRVVVVVREQIGYVNSLYCDRVLALDTARGFADFTEVATPAHRFDYVASFGAVADTDGLELAAVPFPQLVSEGAARSVLTAAGFAGPLPGALPRSSPLPPLPGPVLIGATRLLHKRLRRMNAFHEQSLRVLRELSRRLVAHAEHAGWDDREFFGWDRLLRRSAGEEYAATNAAFAEFVWGGEWPEPFSVGRVNQVDLAELDPAMLSDVLATVEGLISSAAALDAPDVT